MEGGQGKIYRMVDGITTAEYVLLRDGLKSGLYLIEVSGPDAFRGKLMVK